MAVIAPLKFATTGTFTATPVAAFSGETVVTVGAGAVVKLQVYAVPSATPAVLVTVPAMVAVYTVLAARLAEGVSVAVAPDTATVAVTLLAEPAASRLNVLVVKVAAVMLVLNVAAGLMFSATPVALFNGVVVVTDGGTAAVVNVQVKLAAKFTAAALAAAVVTVAV